MSPAWHNFVRSLVLQSPALLVYGIGLILSIFRWKRHPRISRLVSVSTFMLVVLTPAFLGFYVWFPTWARDNGWIVADADHLVYGVAFIQAVINAVAYGLVLWAAYDAVTTPAAPAARAPAATPMIAPAAPPAGTARSPQKYGGTVPPRPR